MRMPAPSSPGDIRDCQIDWQDVLPAGITLVSVVHGVPVPLTKVSESTDVGNARSTVRVSGGTHGGCYSVIGRATLSNGEVLDRVYPDTCFYGAG